MIRRCTGLLLLVLVLMMSIAPATAEMMAGGWENVPCEAGILPEGAQAAFDKATEQLDGAIYTPVALLIIAVAVAVKIVLGIYVRATGVKVKNRIFRHLVPNVMPQLIVTATMGIGGVIITESTLSFLGACCQCTQFTTESPFS